MDTSSADVYYNVLFGRPPASLSASCCVLVFPGGSFEKSSSGRRSFLKHHPTNPFTKHVQTKPLTFDCGSDPTKVGSYATVCKQKTMALAAQSVG